MTYRFISVLTSGFLTLSMCGGSSFGQSLGLISIELDGWSYLPVIDQGDVEAIVCLRSQESGLSINALWCEPSGDGAWSALAWEGASPEEISSFVFDHVGATAETLDNLALLWPVEIDPALVLIYLQNPVNPAPFGDGVFLGDVLELLISDYPEVLEPLESVGYSAVSSLSGSSISGGTFGGGTPSQPPVRKDDECVAAVELLNILEISFESTDVSIDIFSQVFEDEMAAANSNCGCVEKTVALSSTGWVYTCGPWIQTAVIQPGGLTNTDCKFNFERTVSGINTKIRKHTYPNCSTATCTQTMFREGFQTDQTLMVRFPGANLSSIWTGTGRGYMHL